MSNSASTDVQVMAARGLAYCGAAATDAAPRYVESDVIAPFRTVGLGVVRLVGNTHVLAQAVKDGPPTCRKFAV